GGAALGNAGTGAFGCGMQGAEPAEGSGGPGAAAAFGAGKAIVSVSLFFWNDASRPLTERSVQPECRSPVLSRTTSLVAWSMKIAMPPESPATAPTRVSCGRSGSGGGAAGAATGSTGGGPAIAGAGGRREGVNSGRSR